MRKKPRRVPNPRTVKKSSDIRRQQPNGVVISGQRVPTKLGVRVPGFTGTSFETYYELMQAGTSTNTFLHPKKDRTIRIMSGIGFVITTDETGKELQQRVIPGDEVVLLRGTTFRVTTSSEPLELLVCQQAKYEKTLQVIETTEVSKDVNPVLLREPTIQDRRVVTSGGGVQRRGTSKAKAQLEAWRTKQPVVQVAANAEVPASAPNVLNAKPSFGKFGEAG